MFNFLLIQCLRTKLLLYIFLNISLKEIILYSGTQRSKDEAAKKINKIIINKIKNNKIKIHNFILAIYVPNESS